MNLYMITNRANGKQYVGITSKQVNDRMSRHRYSAKRGCPYPIHCAIRKYGWENFDVELVGSAATYTELLQWERFIIRELGTQVPNGYNLTEGGRGCHGRKMSEETKRKIGAKNRNTVWTDDMKSKMSATLKLAYVTGKHRRTTDNRGKPAWNRGIPHTPESRVKMSKARSGAKNNHARRFTIYGKEYGYVREAVEDTGLTRMQVIYRLKLGIDGAKYLEPTKWPIWSSRHPKETFNEV